MKTCNKCNEPKPLTDFFKATKAADGRYSICKSCKKAMIASWREAHRETYNAVSRKWRKDNPGNLYASEIKRRYGCSLEEYNRRLIEQKGKCKLCETLHNPAIKRKRLYVDHCHNSQEIRGLLCSGCNSMLGYAKDDVSILLKAIEYLKTSTR